MTKEEFQSFVEKTIENVIQLAEKEVNKSLSRRIVFHWLLQKEKLIVEHIPQHITEKVFIDENNIFPCVDIGVSDIFADGTLVIAANISGHSPRPFGINWQGREGPFIYVIGQTFFDKINKNNIKNAERSR